jgi:hypothetical protein
MVAMAIVAEVGEVEPLAKTEPLQVKAATVVTVT